MATVYKRGNQKNKKGSKWIVNWFDAESGKWRVKTAYTDKQASLKLGEWLEAQSARRKVGLQDAADEHQLRPAKDHLNDFISGLRIGARNERYVMQVEVRIQRILDGLKITRLHELDPIKIQQFLAGLRRKTKPLGGITRNEYICCIKSLTKWAVRNGRLKSDPLIGLSRIERRMIQQTHPRRALTVEEVGRLLHAAETRPVHEVMLCRVGVNVGKPMAKVRPWAIEKMRRVGRQRRLVYEIAILTGLRRSEIKALWWSDIHLDGVIPQIRLRAMVTKSKRADTIIIPPQLAARLKATRPTNAVRNTLVVEVMPGIRTIQADLKFAGIEYGDAESGFADFHALRKTYNTLMARAGVSLSVRQTQMRHADPRLTQSVYMDERLLPVAEELAKLPHIGPTEIAGKSAGSLGETASTTCSTNAVNSKPKGASGDNDRHDVALDNPASDGDGGASQVPKIA